MQYSNVYCILSDVRHFELNIDNQTLLEECKRGDRDAMSILYTRFAPRMLHVISRYVSDRDCAQDILHDGFIAAFTRLDSLRDADRIEFWLATIMKNLSLKYLQAQSVTSILDEIPETVEEPELEDILDFATLESLIRQLPEGYQKVFRLAVLEGKSHKEISEILGIAPNSSSSQLFHAKLRLRELIKDYQLRAGILSLLLLIVSAGLLFLSRKVNDIHSEEPLTAEDTREKPAIKQEEGTEKATPVQKPPTMLINSEVAESLASSELPTDVTAISSDSIADKPETPKDGGHPIHPHEEEYVNERDRLFADIPMITSSDKAKGWSAGIAFDPGMASFSGIGGNDFASPGPPSSDPEPPGPDDDNQPSKSRMPGNVDDLESVLSRAPHRHHLPISFAITAEKHFSSWLGLESGIGYSYLHTDFERYTSNGTEVTTCHWHYLEIPLKVNLYAYTSPRFKVYGSLGGRVAIPVYSYAQMPHNSNVPSGTFNSKTVWSVGGSIGVSYRLSTCLDLFIEPSLRYHFPQEAKVPNVWTDDTPWSISIPIGLRLNW